MTNDQRRDHRRENEGGAEPPPSGGIRTPWRLSLAGLAGAYVALVAGVALTAGVARAEGERPPQQRRTPPPAAFEACRGKNAAEACSVSFGERRLDGVCQAADDGHLFCRPARPMGPPPEAVEACREKQVGATCAVKLGPPGREHSVEGTCAAGPDGAGPLACRPDRPEGGGPPPGPPPERA